MDLTLFSLGLLAAVPIGIGTNVATPLVTAWWAKRNESRRVALEKKTAARQSVLGHLSTDNDALTHDMLTATLRIAALSALAAVSGGVAFIGSQALGLLNSVSPLSQAMSLTLSLVGQLAVMVVAILVFNTAAEALGTNREVRDIKKRRDVQILTAVSAARARGEDFQDTA